MKRGIWTGLWITSEHCENGIKMPDCGSIGVMQTYNGMLKTHAGPICVGGFILLCLGLFTRS